MNTTQTQDLILNPTPLGVFVLSLAVGYINSDKYWVSKILYSLSILLIITVLAYGVYLNITSDQIENARHYYLIGLVSIILAWIGMTIGEKLGVSTEEEEVRTMIQKAKDEVKEFGTKAEETAKRNIAALKRQIKELQNEDVVQVKDDFVKVMNLNDGKTYKYRRVDLTDSSGNIDITGAQEGDYLSKAL